MTPHITVTDEDRARKFVEIFGSATVPVRSPQTVVTWFRGHDWPCYFLDLDALDIHQHNRLVKHLADTRGILRIDAEADLRRSGYPIVAENTLLISSPQFWE